MASSFVFLLTISRQIEVNYCISHFFSFMKAALRYSVLPLYFFPWTYPYSFLIRNNRLNIFIIIFVVRAGKLTVVNHLSIAFQARIKIIKFVGAQLKHSLSDSFGAQRYDCKLKLITPCTKLRLRITYSRWRRKFDVMFESHPKFKLLEQIKLFIFKCVNEDSR